MNAHVPYVCRDIVDLVTEYLDGGLSRNERLGFERHVAICPPCRAHLSQMRRVVRAAPALGGEELPSPLRDELLRAFADWRVEQES